MVVKWNGVIQNDDGVEWWQNDDGVECTGRSEVICMRFTTKKFYTHGPFHIDLPVISIKSD